MSLDPSVLEFESLISPGSADFENDPTVETPSDALLIGQTLGLVQETLTFLEDTQTEAQHLRARQVEEEEVQRRREEERMRRLKIIAEGYRHRRREQHRQERLRQRQKQMLLSGGGSSGAIPDSSSIDGLSDLDQVLDVFSESEMETQSSRSRSGSQKDTDDEQGGTKKIAAAGPLSPLHPASSPTLGLGFGIDEAVLLAASDLSLAEAKELEHSESSRSKRKRILLYCCVEGLPSPFCLLANAGLSDQHYIAIISQYYTSVLFQGQPPGELVLLKRVIFGKTVQQLLREEKIIQRKKKEIKQEKEKNTNRNKRRQRQQDIEEENEEEGEIEEEEEEEEGEMKEEEEEEEWEEEEELLPFDDPDFDPELQRNRNQHRLYHFKRRFDIRAHKFRMHVQMHMPVYDEPMPSHLSIETKRRGAGVVVASSSSSASSSSASASVSASASISAESGAGGAGGSNSNSIGVGFPTIISLNRLILLVTDPYCDKRLLDVLWWQYREFLTPQILLEKLIQRFDVPPLSTHTNTSNSSSAQQQDQKNHSGEELRFFDSYLRRQIRINVARMLSVFILKYPFDFDDAMASKLRSFAARSIAREFPYIARLIGRGLKKPRVHVYELPRQDLIPPKPYVGQPPKFDIFEYSPRVLAEQLTFIDFEIYESIDFSEMLNCAWEKSNREKIAPDLIKSERFHDRVRWWVASWILMKDRPEERAKVVEHLIQTFSELFHLNSCNVLHAFYDAFGLTPVYRLSRTWDLVDRQLNLKREEIADHVAPGREHKLQALMDRCHNTGLPCCPFIRLYLRFLKDKGREDGLVTGRINLEKFRSLTGIMKNVLRFQSNRFDLRPEAGIIWHVLDFEMPGEEKVREEQLSARSMKLES